MVMSVSTQIIFFFLLHSTNEYYDLQSKWNHKYTPILTTFYTTSTEPWNQVYWFVWESERETHV